jgi:two-component system, sensor histidine kinase and response regulator
VERALSHPGYDNSSTAKIPTPEQLGRRSKQRVLVVDDNAINQKIAVKFTMKLGYQADAVGSAHEAFAALRNLPYDLVLMDCQMPDIDGYEAAKTIRESKAFITKDIPIIAMTANAMQGDREKCIEAGMNDYVSKPIRIPELQVALEKWNGETNCDY